MKKRNGRRAIKKREKKALKRYEEFMKPFYTQWSEDAQISRKADYEPTLRVLTIRDVEL